MTLFGAILKKVQSQDSMINKYSSPPPEIEDITRTRKRKPDKYAHVKAIVDSQPPLYDYQRLLSNDRKWRRQAIQLVADNKKLVMAIRLAQLNRGKVDSHWGFPLPCSNVYYDRRVSSFKRIQKENNILYKLFKSARPRVQTTSLLEQNWKRNQKEIVQRVQNKLVLFCPIPEETVEGVAFRKPKGVRRSRAHLSIGMRGGAVIGEIKVELFEDVCPETCGLFLELLDGRSGFGYVGTCFFRKVPGLFWCGGDVVHDNGFGCYAQYGRKVPIGAENFHFPHSMPGLLSMRVSRDNEVCGSFNITFKPLPQFDLKNVVFGRVVRPCRVLDAIREIGNALSTYPVVELSAARRMVEGKWRFGAKNTKMPIQ